MSAGERQGEQDLPTVESLEALADLVARQRSLYVRWSKGPGVDAARNHSRDDLTSVELPGLSANALDVEDWWGDRPIEVWVARRLYDYLHLEERRGPDVRPWVLTGHEVGRGPDNEPLVELDRPVAWVSDQAVAEARQLVERHGNWGPLDRTG